MMKKVLSGSAEIKEKRGGGGGGCSLETYVSDRGP